MADRQGRMTPRPSQLTDQLKTNNIKETLIMTNNNFITTINNLKANNSCYNYLTSTCGLIIHHNNSTINAPSFIRDHDNSPSFYVSDSHCYDFATHQYYSIIDLVMLHQNIDFKDACNFLNGSPLDWGGKSSCIIDNQHSHDYHQADSRVAFWHEQLLSNNDMLHYLHSRKISDETINTFMLGYSPNQQRIMFPYKKNSHYVFWNGRDMSGRCNLDSHHPDHQPKYRKPSLKDDNALSILEPILWGCDTLRPHSKSRQTYKAVDGQVYEIDSLNPKDDTLCVFEGMFDALSFAQEGWQVQATGGGIVPQSQFKHFIDTCRLYKQVFLCFDNDNPGQGFLRSMSTELFKAGIRFTCGQVPHEVNGQPVKDVSDYYVAGGSLEELVEKATPGLVYLAGQTKTPQELEAVFMKAARNYSGVDLFQLKEACLEVTPYPQKFINFIFMQAQKPIPEPDVAKMVDDKHTLLFDDSGLFYEYAKGIWQEISDFTVQHYVADALGNKASSSRMKAVTSFLKAIHAGKYTFNRKPVFVFPNGTLHLDEQDTAKAFSESRPEDMATQRMNYNYDPFAQALKWEAFINAICNGNPEKIRLMKQIGGYIMFTDNRLQKMFYFIGDGANGKSVFMNVLEQVYGSENCASIQPSRLGGQFDPIALKDAYMNFCYEAKSLVNGCAEELKSVVSGDPITAAHKGVDAVKFKTRAKFIMAANKLFNVNDVSFGLIRRMLFVRFDRQFIGDSANKNLYNELLAELPGIFNWCYQGYLDLKESGAFQWLAEQDEVLEQFTHQMPVWAFMREELTHIDNSTVNERDVYALYREWADDGGYKRLNRSEFMAEMKLILRQERMANGLNIKLKEATDGRTQDFVFGNGSTEAKTHMDVIAIAPAVQSVQAAPAVCDQTVEMDASCVQIHSEEQTTEQVTESTESGQVTESAESHQQLWLDTLEEFTENEARLVRPSGSMTSAAGDDAKYWSERKVIELMGARLATRYRDGQAHLFTPNDWETLHMFCNYHPDVVDTLPGVAEHFQNEKED